ncbi:MAG: hypothetical protein ACSW71_04210 [Methanobrevibacter sp.]
MSREDIVVANKFLPRSEDDIKNDVSGQQHIHNMVEKKPFEPWPGLVHLSHVGL